jgi:hypothetical protein
MDASLLNSIRSAQKERKERKWNFYVDWLRQKFGVFSASSLRLFDR